MRWSLQKIQKRTKHLKSIFYLPTHQYIIDIEINVLASRKWSDTVSLIPPCIPLHNYNVNVMCPDAIIN